MDFNGLAAATHVLDCCDVPTPVSLNEVKENKFRILYAHPGTLVSATFISLLKCICNRVCAVAVDEAHMVLEW